MEQIKSTYRLPRNELGEPSHIPSKYEVFLNVGGLYEEDRNADGYFEFSADTGITFTHNTDSKFIVLNAGAIPGYEVTNVKMECGDKYIETDYEHYKEKEMLIVSILVSHQLLW